MRARNSLGAARCGVADPAVSDQALPCVGTHTGRRAARCGVADMVLRMRCCKACIPDQALPRCHATGRRAARHQAGHGGAAPHSLLKQLVHEIEMRVFLSVADARAAAAASDADAEDDDAAADEAGSSQDSLSPSAPPSFHPLKRRSLSPLLYYHML